MMLHPVFVASVLEGFEGTLDEMIGRVANPELNSQLDALRSRAAAIRISIEEPFAQAVADQTTASGKLNLWRSPLPGSRSDFSAPSFVTGVSRELPVSMERGRGNLGGFRGDSATVDWAYTSWLATNQCCGRCLFV